jgi:ATP/maltotriose-dependent transcriptional regulator MalT
MAYVGQLVGRAAELGRLGTALGLDGQRAASALLLSGEPGIGKSALLAEAARIGAARGHLVLEGRASELEREVPFGVFIDALDDYLASLQPRRLSVLAQEQRRDLASVFPALPDPGGAVPSLPQERYRSHRAVRALLALLAAPRPLVLVLDDLHWADQASLELLDHLLRRPPTGPSLLLLAHRSGRAPAPLLAAVRAGCERIALAPLSRLDAGPLLEAVPEAGLRERVYVESGGNPFYLEQLVRAAARGTLERVGGTDNGTPRRQLEPDPVSGAEIPQAVSDALAEELDGLPADARLVLRAAAVAGEPFRPDLVAAVGELEQGRVLESLDLALGAALIRATDSPLWFRFRHPIVRRVVYASAGAAWRIGAHARAASLLAAQGASPATRAHHVERSAAPGDPEAIAVLSEAGHATSALAPATAAAWFGAALRLLPDEPGPGRRLALLGPRAAALGAAGRLREAHAALAEVHDLIAPEQVAVRGRIVGFMAVIDRLLGRHGEARQLLQRSLRGLPDPASREAAELQLELAADRFFAGDFSTMHAEALIGWRTAASGHDDGLKAAAAGVLGLAEYSLGRLPGARDRLREARDLLDADGAERARLDAYDWLAWLELSMEEHDAALEHFSRGLELGRRTGGGHLLSTMTFGLVLGSVWSGRLTEALEHSETTLELARLSGSEQVMSWSLGLRTLVHLRTGSLTEAIAHGEEALALEHSVAPNPFSAVNAGWLGEARIESGQVEQGREQILAAFGGDDLPRVESAFRPFVYDVLTGAELALGRVDAAAEWAVQARATADGLELPGRTGAALHAGALVMLARGDAKPAARDACQAAELLGLAHPIESARARILAGQALAAAGERELALAELRRSATESTALGALRYAAQAIRELRRLGQRVGQGGRRGLATAGLPALSGRELQVVELVAARLTNREIAERLVLSEKTVERHLSRIFVKLGARSRVDVARIAEASTRV